MIAASDSYPNRGMFRLFRCDCGSVTIGRMRDGRSPPRLTVEESGEPRWVMHWSEVAVFDANAAALGIEAIDLMAAAGAALAGQAVHMVRSANDGLLPDRPVWILCGPGNNGGDGFACALGLVEEGLEVRFQCTHAAQRSDEAQEFRERCREAGIVEETWPLSLSGRRPCLVIDCLLGAGSGDSSATAGEVGSAGTARLRGSVAAVVEWVLNTAPRVPVLACDMPTGIGGADMLEAAATVTFHSEKMGLRPTGMDGVGTSENTSPGVGSLHVASLPWPDEVQECGPGDALRHPPLDPEARKGDRGRLLIVGGGPYHGAPLLAGRAATRVGCDLVHVAMPKVAAERADWPADLIPETLPDDDIATLHSIESIEGRLTLGRGCQALLVGPGLGDDESTLAMVRELLLRAERLGIPCIIDADAIAALPSAAWPAGLKGVATPHSREAAAWLSGISPESVLDALSDGFDDPEEVAIVVTGPEDQLFGLNGRRCAARGGHPRMAVGGTGDLLAGAIAGLIAQGMAAWPSARLGCALLRTAGESAATRFGTGLVASDVPPHIAMTLAAWLPDRNANEDG